MLLIRFFIHNPVKVTVGVLLVSLFGTMAMFDMPMQLIPEVEIPTIGIETTWPGASPQEVEREIVQEQEEQLQKVEGVTKMTSESMDSMGRITLEFPVGTEMREAMVKVLTRLQQVREYPEAANEPVINTSSASDRPIAWFMLGQKNPSDAEIVAFQKEHPAIAAQLEPIRKAHNPGLKTHRLRKLAETHSEVATLLPKEIDISTLRRFAEDNIETRFENVPGVSNCEVMGGREDEVQVVVDPEKLAARQLTISDLRNALRNQNVDTSGGDFWEGKRRYPIRTLGQFRELPQVEAVIIARHDDQPVYVRDVAEVRMGHKKPDGFVHRFGSNYIAIRAQRAIGTNVIDVVAGLSKANTELNAGVLKQHDLECSLVYDETHYIQSSVDLVTDNLLQGSALTFVTLLLFLRSARSTAVIFLHIIVSTMGAFLAMKMLGRTLNVPALGGLAFAVGMLVDNAIVMLENIYRRHQQGEDAETASVRGAQEVWGALLNATLANLAVFIPVLFVKEEAGQLFRDIALAISAAVAFSMIVAVTVVPTAAYRLLRGSKKLPSPSGRVRDVTPPGAFGRLVNLLLAPVDFLARAFVSAVVATNAFLQRRLVLRLALVVITGGGAAGLSWAMMPKVEYLPQGNRNLVIGFILPPPGYNLDQLKAMGEQIEQELKPYWDVDPTSPEAAQLDFPVIGDFFYVARNRQVFLGLRAHDPMEAHKLVPLVRRMGERLPGTMLSANQSSLFERGLTAGRTIDIEIMGPELTRLVALGGGVMGKVKELIPDAQVIPRPSLDMSNPEVHVLPKWEQAADLRMTAQDLGYVVDCLVDGAYATDYFIGGDKIDLRIVGEERFARRTQDVKALPIAMPGGELVALGALADVKLSTGPEQINHRSRQRAITIQVTPPTTMPLEAAMNTIQDQIVAPLVAGGDLAGGYRVDLAGTADKLRATWHSLRFNVILAVLITYLLMSATFESWLYPLVVILTVPLGAVGGFVGLWLLNRFGYPQQLDVLTMLGFIMLVGTVVNNPILIVEQSLIHLNEDKMPLREAILESVRNRIRPIFMTTFGGLVGLLPLVLAPGAGSELYRGIGAILLGGLLLSTFVTLVFVPVLLTLMMEMKRAIVRWLGWEDAEAVAESTVVALDKPATEHTNTIASPAEPTPPLRLARTEPETGPRRVVKVKH
ncbi:MAG: efflux RND transporter permease subunit [Planctomycetales bacterium]|nr:efflux RND transporter permease subunit [Planctomycetales bacterium]